jgi:multidrug resistance efflux pump
MRFGAKRLIGLAIVTLGPAAWTEPPGEGRPGERVPVEVVSRFEARCALLEFQPDGSLVKKGEVVCTFDSGPLKDRLAVQDLVVSAREAKLRGATLAREAAELAVKEYLEEGLPEKLQAARDAAELAGVEVQEAEDRAEWSNRMLARGYVSVTDNVGVKVLLKQKRLALEQAKRRQAKLGTISKERTLKTLESQVEAARGAELLDRARFERARAARVRLARQVDECRVAAPASGRLHYPGAMAKGREFGRGELLFRILPD